MKLTLTDDEPDASAGPQLDRETASQLLIDYFLTYRAAEPLILPDTTNTPVLTRLLELHAQATKPPQQTLKSHPGSSTKASYPLAALRVLPPRARRTP